MGAVGVGRANREVGTAGVALEDHGIGREQRHIERYPMALAQRFELLRQFRRVTLPRDVRVEGRRRWRRSMGRPGQRRRFAVRQPLTPIVQPLFHARG